MVQYFAKKQCAGVIRSDEFLPNGRFWNQKCLCQNIKKWLSETRDFLHFGNFGNFESFEKNYYCCKLIFNPDFWLFPKALPWPNFFRALKKHGKSSRPRKS